MSKQLGRISGGVLKDNLERRGSNLVFKNTSDDMSLLHLDVNNSKIGVNTDSPGDDLSVPVKIRSTNSISKFFNIANFSLTDSEIQSNYGNIYLSSNGNIFATSVASDDLKLDFNAISTYSSDTNIDLKPNNNGKIEIYSNWNITGNLHATGDITFGGSLTLGDDDTDTIRFESEVDSDIIPDQDGVGDLGSSNKAWDNTYSKHLVSANLQANKLKLNDINVALTQGNIIYVSENGSDTNNGDHQQGPFRTIRRAIEEINNNSLNEVTISLTPGLYEEDFPIEVPENVSIIGSDLRNTIIQPTSTSKNKDAFLVNESTVIENLTVRDFYYNDIDNTGYAFKFLDQALISYRSPYIRNVSVITKGSIRSIDDPIGFNSGDAGRGAHINGASVHTNSKYASMLFHSVTFITPGTDCLVMTNGVRVEWLNSFIYFANRGLYATDGASGRLMSDSTVEYGAELRSIGSANIYGNYGAYADGVNCIFYLVGHNFSYIGSGADSSNDSTLNIQSHETVELNFGKIHLTTTDAFGTFRIGDKFFVNHDTGETSINSDQVTFTGLSSLFVNSGSNVTFVNGARIDTGNIRVSGNTILNTRQDLSFLPQSGVVRIDSNKKFVISSGTNKQRTSATAGIRYNTDADLYEGFSTASVAFGGIYSEDRTSSITATQLTNKILFEIENNLLTSLSAQQFTVHSLTDFNLNISDNIITSKSDTDINILKSNNANVYFDEIMFNSNLINNTSNNVFTINSTNNGYAKFDSTTGLIIPFGTSSQRSSNPQIGDTRWNTDLNILETWNGSIWQRSAGVDDNITPEVFQEIIDIYTLVLG